ncbi:hypothetical protein [Paenibacillus xylanexedens]|uniref:hypothetical protein n=1 Tax=Paenibacillus xylanexedens TaxID=528191 RepID=UPI0011A214D2|nr:hypothetical protein [Paenibacillus xylanexedens]
MKRTRSIRKMIYVDQEGQGRRRINLTRKLLVALVTSLSFAFIVSIPSVNDMEGFGVYMIVFLLFGTPPIFLIGIPSSILLDKWLAPVIKKNKAYFIGIHVIAYAMVGFLGTYLYLFTLNIGKVIEVREALSMTLYGIIAAVLFFLIDVGIKGLVQARNANNEQR